MIPGLVLAPVPAVLGLARHAATRRENLARHPLRSAILAAIGASCGIVLSDLRRRLGCSAGTIQHHLRHLERSGLVAHVSLNHRRWLFPAGTPADACVGLAVLHSGRTWDLARSLARTPGQIQRDLSRGLGASRRLVREQMHRLVRSGLAVGVPRGRSTAYHPTERLLRLLAVQEFGLAALAAPAPDTPLEAPPLPLPVRPPSPPRPQPDGGRSSDPSGLLSG